MQCCLLAFVALTQAASVLDESNYNLWRSALLLSRWIVVICCCHLMQHTLPGTDWQVEQLHVDCRPKINWAQLHSQSHALPASLSYLLSHSHMYTNALCSHHKLCGPPVLGRPTYRYLYLASVQISYVTCTVFTGYIATGFEGFLLGSKQHYHLSCC